MELCDLLTVGFAVSWQIMGQHDGIFSEMWDVLQGDACVDVMKVKFRQTGFLIKSRAIPFALVHTHNAHIPPSPCILPVTTPYRRSRAFRDWKMTHTYMVRLCSKLLDAAET